MKATAIPQAPIQTAYVQFTGGLDLTTPVLSLKPGSALDAMNYEPGLMGGYRRIDGFERIDGQPAPSSAGYLYMEGEINAPIATGAAVIGETSEASGVVVSVDTDKGIVCVTKADGEFIDGEALLVDGAAVFTLSSTPVPAGWRDAKSDALTRAAAADLYRADIGAVPGSGPVRGVWMHEGVLYAWRDTASATRCCLYKATPAGWSLVRFDEEISFTNANAKLAEGATLMQGTAAATIARVVLESGTLASGTNAGRLILTNRSGIAFAAGAATATGTATLTLGGPSAPIIFLPGGRFEHISTNFAGSTSTYRMYGCDGVNRAFEFDGSVMVPIRTGMANDAPRFIVEHKKKLFLTFKASVQYSGDGLPYQWNVLQGAGEIGMGEDITGMAVQAGDTLAIFTRNASYQLNGATNNTFQLLPISKDIGALPYTVQVVGKTLGLDDRGVIATDRTQAYGNFIQSTISARVQPLIEQMRSRVVGSTVYRSRSQYRLYGSDGSGLVLAFNESGLIGVTQLQYPVKPVCFASCEDSAGRDVVFFGADNGYVYQADSGTSFDGAAIEAFIRMPFNTVGSPRVRKRFRKAVMSMSATGYAAIRFQPEFSDGDPDVGTHRLQTGEIVGTGGYWDAANWDTFYFDARVVSSPAFSIEGTGLNMALLFYSGSAIDESHLLQGVMLHFTPRRLER